MLHEMAIKLRNAQSKIKNLGLRDTKGRVATLLLNLYRKHGDENNEFTLELNRQEMASLLGTTRETVSRTLSEFRNEGLIELDGNRVKIKDLEGWRGGVNDSYTEIYNLSLAGFIRNSSEPALQLSIPIYFILGSFAPLIVFSGKVEGKRRKGFYICILGWNFAGYYNYGIIFLVVILSAG